MSEKVGLAGNINLPVRQASTMSVMSDDAVPDNDPHDTSSLLAERLQAWKHAVGYLEDYVSATEKAHKAHGKEYEKILKIILNPLKEAHHFDQSLGGIAGMFENMRQNTQGMVNSHLETEKNLRGSVLPILNRLHQEIKNKSKELSSGAVKGAKDVEKARNITQKHIELLGQHTAGFHAAGGKLNANEDPYVVQRQTYHRLNKQVLEENSHHHDLLAVQSNFAQFEGHIVEVIQQAMMSFNQFVGGQAEKDQQLVADMLGAAQAVPPNFEWAMFNERSQAMLADPNAPDRTVDGVSFPNQGHVSTKPLIEGTLERKSRNKLSISGYSTGYYVVTPSKYLHEFKDNDNFRKDPSPEMSIYLPDATIGATNNEKFNVKGKDVSGGLTSKLSGTSEIAFKAHTAADAAKWFEVIRAVAGAAPAGTLEGSEPNSPISPTEKRAVSNPILSQQQQPSAIQTSGVTNNSNITGENNVASSPATATPVVTTTSTSGEAAS